MDLTLHGLELLLEILKKSGMLLSVGFSFKVAWSKLIEFEGKIDNPFILRLVMKKNRLTRYKYKDIHDMGHNQH